MFPAICILLCLQLIQGSPLDRLSDKDDTRPLCPCGNEIHSLNTRVVGGRDSGRNEFSYASALVFKFTDKEEQEKSDLLPFCGATLITDRHVLTAGHCLRMHTPDYIAVDVADYSMHDSSDGQVLQSQRLVQFPEYKPDSFHTDIGIVELKKPVKFGENVRTALLPNPKLELKPGTTVSVFGWGRLNYTGTRPDKLQTVDLPVVENDKCQEHFHSTIEDAMLCAGGEMGRDACIGDSGSGLVVRLDNEYVLCGVVSFGRRCALPGVPGVYTKVSRYIDWIKEQTKSAGCRPCIQE